MFSAVLDPHLLPEDRRPHIFSILTAVVSGFIWSAWGYQYVFLLAAAIALVNLASATRIRIPPRPAAARDAEVTARAGA